MHNAIAYPRLHYPKTQIVGIYCPDGELAPPPRAATPSEDETHPGTKHRRAWKKTWKLGAGGDTCVCVPNAKGQTFKTMGKADSFNRMWLLPEEALYLLERGSLDIRWRAAPQTTSSGSDKSDAASTNAEAGIPMSLQAAYACFLGRGGLTLERYTVFSGLRRGGYVVLRAPTWDESAEPAGSTSASDGESVVAPLPASSAVAGLFSRLFAWIYRGGTSYTADTIRGPVVGLGLHRSYSELSTYHLSDVLRLTMDTRRHIPCPLNHPVSRSDVLRPVTASSNNSTLPPRLPRIQTVHTIPQDLPRPARLPISRHQCANKSHNPNS
jgi:tRNA-splicing endonuclease subunit Sen54